MVHLALQKRGLAGLGALLLANLQAFGERPLPRNFGLDPVRLLLAVSGTPLPSPRLVYRWIDVNVYRKSTGRDQRRR